MSQSSGTVNLSRRINWLLILQAWAILWVVIGHANLGEPGQGPEWENVLYRFAYSFHMQLFMFISGYLFYCTRLQKPEKWTYFRVIVDKAKRLLVPMVFFMALAFLLKGLFPSEMAREASLTPRGVLNAFLYPQDSPLKEMWFIATLFWLFLLMPFWKVVLKSVYSTAAVALLLVLCHVWHPEVKLFCIEYVFIYAVYFFLGIVSSRYRVIESAVSGNRILFLLAGIVLYVIGRLYFGLLSALGGILVSTVISLFLDKVWPKAFRSFRDYTYQIFLMGIFAQIAVKILYRHTGIPYVMAFALSVAAGIYIPVLVSLLVKRINFAPLSVCLGLRTEQRQNK